MYYIDWGLFALGLLIGIVGTVTTMLALVVVEPVETGKDGKKMKDCFDKPIKVVNICEIRVGDFIHDVSCSSLIDSEKRKGYVVSASIIDLGQIVLRLTGRKTPLELPAGTDAVITRASLPTSSAFNLLPKQPNKAGANA